MRILTWNIRHGGKPNKRELMIRSIVEKQPNVIILTEYRVSRMKALRDDLCDKGWTNQLVSTNVVKVNSILMASGDEIYPSGDASIRPNASQRWLEVELPARHLKLLGVHIPGSKGKWGKEPFWRAVLEYARRERDARAVIMGDFNTGLAVDAEGTPFALSERMEELISLGWVDAWRSRNPTRREYTWYSSAGNGFRLDYAFVSPPLADRIIDASISHEERLAGLSDHSSLVVELDV